MIGAGIHTMSLWHTPHPRPINLTNLTSPTKINTMITKDKQYLEMRLTPQQSNFACPVCHTPVHIKHEEEIINEHGVICENKCIIDPDKVEGNQDVFYIFEASVVLRPGYKNLAENPQIATEMSWYHISKRSPQQMEFDTGMEMHVGTLETVKRYRDQIRTWRNQVQDYYVYELKMVDVDIEPELLKDINYWLPQEQALYDGIDGRTVYAYRYVNRWEAPGTISLIARRDIFEIVNVTKNALPDKPLV